jgi:hypothetical protein
MPSQYVSPPAQRQAPWRQETPAGQATLQSPQCAAFDVTDVQVPAQQSCPGPHAFPQEPQCSGSWVRSTQALSQ